MPEENSVPSPSIQIAVLQSTSISGNPEKNMETLSRWASKAARQGTQLLVTPELFVPGYEPSTVYAVDGAEQRRTLAEIAAKHQIGLVASTVEFDGDNKYICASLFDRNGNEVARYRKMHLFGEAENKFFSTSTVAPKVVEFRGMKVALGICFDVEFPEFVRSAALAGAELLCVPTAVPSRDATPGNQTAFDSSLVPTLLVRARAVESQIYIAYANQAGSQFVGRSTIVSPMGESILASEASENLLKATIDRGTLAHARSEVGYLDVVRNQHRSSN
ncbi:carbon-nitrogen hydrolase [Glutamicibacter sp. JL.03c]|uniref:nitrilase-related carbon-nitrogen hydrolase n=1 Tax=Glutamicibacter sp. JL.03c TaxID=2984842 RepID=UPI0021F743B5|nr:nitrilase-related carbon-nitrogen hydrolase [Glutamicibacter sp. JL.03c]UYQ77471.1 carbon-nitrogen hydrolase [Glutamicibacter sp. JL.03c]